MLPSLTPLMLESISWVNAALLLALLLLTNPPPPSYELLAAIGVGEPSNTLAICARVP